jgi:hypothetical protein
VHANTFAADSLPASLDRLYTLVPHRPTAGDPQWLAEQVRRALRHLHHPTALARSLLVSAPGTPDIAVLRKRLRHAIEQLAASNVPEHAAAGQLLAHRYLNNENIMRWPASCTSAALRTSAGYVRRSHSWPTR